MDKKRKCLKKGKEPRKKSIEQKIYGRRIKDHPLGIIIASVHIATSL